MDKMLPDSITTKNLLVMSNAKVKNFFDFRKEIVVTDWHIGKEGAEIHYDHKGRELSLLANVEQTCSLLENIGTIKGYAFENDTHWVRVEIELEGAKPRLVMIEWKQFLLSYDFAQYEAIYCAAWHEAEKELHNRLNNAA